MYNVERPAPTHWYGAETSKHSGVRAHVDEAHTGIIGLRDADFTCGEDPFEPKPSAESKPSKLVKRVDPVKGYESPAERPIRVTALSTFKLRAAEAHGSKGGGRREGGARGCPKLEIGEPAIED